MTDAREELGRDERARRAQARDDASVFEGLVAHPGWVRYRALVEAVAQNYYSTVMKPMDSVMDATKVEYAKGALAGLSAAVSLPEMKIKEVSELRRSAMDDEE